MKINPTLLWQKYRYFIIFGALGVWISFFDSNSLLSLWKLNREANLLKKESSFFREEIQIAKEKRDYLFSNDRNLEKFARENYLMKRENEDVFIIVKETK